MEVKANSELRKQVFRIDKEQNNQSTSRITWNKDHDAQLLLLVQQNKGRNWKKIASEMQKNFHNPDLTAKKCRERWCNCTNPDLDKTSLSDSEELFLLVYHYDYKNKWALISQHLPNRNSSKLKNNFSSLIRKICRKIAINDKETPLSMSSYVQTLYASVLIYDLASLKNKPEEASSIAPIHIYDHIKEKNIEPHQCVEYINRITSAVISRFKGYTRLQKLLNATNIDSIREHMIKIITNIKAQHNPTAHLADEHLAITVENAVCLEKPASPIIPLNPKHSNNFFQPMTSIPQIQIPQLNTNFPRDQFPIMQYQKSLSPVELKLPENVPQFQQVRTPVQIGADMPYQIPQFTSPLFQQSMHSSLSRSGTPSPQQYLVPSGCYPQIITPVQIPIMRTPNQDFMYMPSQFQQFQTPNYLPRPSISLSEKPKQSKSSDFTLLTNKYVH